MSIRKPLLKRLPGDYTISTEVREALNLNDDILTGQAKYWCKPDELVKEYFTKAMIWKPDVTDLYNKILRALSTLKNKEVESYAEEVIIYLKKEEIKTELRESYEHYEGKARLRRQKLRMNLEADISGHAVTTDSIKEIAESSRKRKIIDDEVDSIEALKAINASYDQSLFDETPTRYNEDVVKDQITITKNKKNYQFHIPSTSIISPNKPSLQKEDLTTLETIFDVMISSTRSKSEDVQLKKLYDDYMADQQRNKFISNVPHALDLLKHTVFSSDKFNEVKIWSFMDNSKFIVMMKRVLSDFCLNCERVISVDIDDERTFAAETVVVIFKSLGILCDLSFRWFEKQNDESKSSWLPLSDFRHIKTQLLDGVGTTLNKKVAVFIESSGATKNVNHRVEDSLKNMKSCSDFLKNLTCSFKLSNIETMKKLKIPCINIIGNRLTVSLCFIRNKKKWAYVEARSTIAPSVASEKNHLIKVFEMLAFLEDIINKNHQIINELEMECLGMEPAEFTTIQSYFEL